MGSSSQYARREQLTFLKYLRYRPQQEREGIPPDAFAVRITELSKSLGLPRCKVLAFLGISRAGVSRGVHAFLPLSADETARVLGIESLIGQVRAMVEEGSLARPPDSMLPAGSVSGYASPCRRWASAFRPVTSTRLTDSDSSEKC
jgi:hypothetical protein